MRRQRTRKTLLLVSMLLFPVTLNYLSPYLIINGSFEGVLSGSAVLFGSQFVSALLFGRAFCGWLCPAGGLQDVCTGIQPKGIRRGMDWLKYATWIPWLGAIAAGFVHAGGLARVDILYMTDHGISVSAPGNYIVYLGVVFLIVILSLTLGKRALCHRVCWMAPFMILGTWLREKLRLPGLRLTANADLCVRCGACDKACPMSLPVQEMVQSGKPSSECILCASCADACPKKALRVNWSGAAQKKNALPRSEFPR